MQDLQAGLKKALSGEVETLLLQLLMPPVQFETDRLQQAMVVRVPVLCFIAINVSILLRCRHQRGRMFFVAGLGH